VCQDGSQKSSDQTCGKMDGFFTKTMHQLIACINDSAFLLPIKKYLYFHIPLTDLIDLAPCDFYLFPLIKSLLKGTHFQTVDDVKMKTAELLK